MDAKQRLKSCLSRYRIQDPDGKAVDLEQLAEEVMSSLGQRRKIYSCIKQDLDIECEHEEHELDIIVLSRT